MMDTLELIQCCENGHISELTQLLKTRKFSAENLSQALQIAAANNQVESVSCE